MKDKNIASFVVICFAVLMILTLVTTIFITHKNQTEGGKAFCTSKGYEGFKEGYCYKDAVMKKVIFSGCNFWGEKCQHYLTESEGG